MRPVVVRSLIVVLTGALVLIGVLYVASTVDARAPQVTGFALTQPLPDDSDTALITTSIEVEFNEPVQVEAGSAALTLEPAAQGTVSWAGSTLTFTPRIPLDLSTEYTVTVSRAIRDLSGNRIADDGRTFAFVTAGRPMVAGTDPEDREDEVALDAAIEITFSTLMDTGSVEAATSVEPAFPHELHWNVEVLEIVPLQPFRPNTEYRIRIGGEAADVAGVPLGDPLSVTFRTVAPGLAAITVVPADGVDGVAPTSSIAVIFDRAIDPDSVTAAAISTVPEVTGTVAIVSIDGEPVDDEEADAGVVLRFLPSALLPLNTTFEVTVAAGVRALDGGLLAEAVTWSFTTGAPQATLSNQITFLTERGGVLNVWAMNPNGSGQHQITSELTPVLDYAVSPDGSRLVFADGRRLIAARADGSDRTVLTDEGELEFDPAFAPNGLLIAFGRADGTTGAGLGLWLANADGGEARRLQLPAEVGASPTPTPSPGDGGSGWLRAPRFSPDGQALAYLDVGTGHVGIVELPAERLTRVAVQGPARPPAWLPDSSAVLLSLHPAPPGEPIGDDGRVAPIHLPPAVGSSIAMVNRSGTTLDETDLAPGTVLLAVDRAGRVAHLDADGVLLVGDVRGRSGRAVEGLGDAEILGGAFAPGKDAMVVIVADGSGGERVGRVELLDLQTGERTLLAPGGAVPGWLP